MIEAEFFRHGDAWRGFHVTGHAGFADYGNDVACASVSSALQMTANAITEILHVKAQVDVAENDITLLLSDPENREAQNFIEAFRLHLSLLMEDYENTIQITDAEV